jgi:hypothetical protein
MLVQDSYSYVDTRYLKTQVYKTVSLVDYNYCSSSIKNCFLVFQINVLIAVEDVEDFYSGFSFSLSSLRCLVLCASVKLFFFF